MAETLDGLKVRIHELEKEVERWKSQVKSVRYGLNWMDVPEAFDKDSEDKIPILEEVAEKAVNAKGPLASRPPHVIIEGDNYHALTCLNYTHRGKIDVIYIDPPYNTGSDGFTYKDKRFLTEFPDGQKVPKEHPLRHSYWLSFMEKRLNLAKKLLRDEGVIFISIDDNEQANLKLLCDKVFKEENFITSIPRITKRGGKSSDAIARNHDYLMVYSKTSSYNLIPFEHDDSDFKYKDEFYEERGFYKLNQTLDYDSLQYSAGLDYPLNFQGEIFYPGSSKEKYDERKKGNFKRADWAWRWSKEKFKFGEENGFIVLKKSKNGKRIYTKTYQNATIEDDGDGYKVVIKKRTAPVSTLKLCENEFSNDNATKDLVEVLGKKDFDYSKPVSLLYFIEKIATHPSSSGTFRPPVILDFFAGSGTTLHATLNLNKEDGGIRQCILVQQSEGDNNICENVTYERNRRVMCGYTSISAQGKQTEVEGLGGSLKYYKTGFVGKHQSKNANDADKVELAEKAGCLIALAENTLETVVVPSTAKGFWQIYSDNAEKKKRYTCIYHNGDYGKVSDFVAKIDELRATDKKSKFTVYVFSWNSPDFFENEFDDLKNIEIKAIPKPILEIYKALNG